MTNRKFLFLGGFLAVSCVVLAAPGCGDDDDDDATSAGTTQSTSTGTPAGTGGEGTGGEGTGGDTGGQGTGGQGTGGQGTGGQGTGGSAVNCADPPAPSAECQAYCDAIMTNCTGANAQYSSEAACLGACAAFPPGMPSDMSGNTLGCRTYHAGAAAQAPDVHCVHAGPGGAGACGNNCEGFCTIAMATCDGLYANSAACMTECSGFPDTEKYDASDAAGDSLACRLYHLTVASSDAASCTTHCPHIVEASPVCK